MGISSDATDALDDVDDIVVFVQPNGGTSWKVYGAKNGLWKTSQSFMTNDNMGTTAFEFGSREGLEEVFESYNTSIDISALVDMDSFDLIYSGTIANGGDVKLTIDSSKTGYIKLPNGSVLVTTAGVINTTYTGVGGAVTYYVAKANTDNSLLMSDIAGEIMYTGAGGIILTSCYNATSLIANSAISVAINDTTISTLQANKAISIDAEAASLTAKSIGDILYYANLESREDVVYSFNSGLNANHTAIAAYMLATYGLDLDDVLENLTSGLGGTITLNT